MDFNDLSVKQQIKCYHISMLGKIINGYRFETKKKYLEELDT